MKSQHYDNGRLYDTEIFLLYHVRHGVKEFSCPSRSFETLRPLCKYFNRGFKITTVGRVSPFFMNVKLI
jgi:hypothetical protein